MPKFSEEERLHYRLKSLLKKAVREYALIQENDELLVGLSGGKDSMALVELLGDMSKVLRPRFSVQAVHIVMTNIPYVADTEYLKSHCEAHGVTFHQREVSFDATGDKRKSPCFLCSWNRRKILFDTAQELGCHKIVLGHHRDDILETLLMNMFFQGSIQAMPPLLQMDKFNMQVIRPLCLIPENDLKQWAEYRQYHEQIKSCPYEKESYRPEIRQMIEDMNSRYPGVKDSLWASMQHIYPRYLPGSNKD